MGLFDIFNKVKDFMEESSNERSSSYSRQTNTSYSFGKIGGKTLSQWDNEWKYIGILSETTDIDLPNEVGLYRAKLNGKVVYIGRAIEYSNGGLRKRLRDYTRASNSARKHGSGRLMNEHQDELRIEILIVGNSEDDAKLTRELERAFIAKYKPAWNKQLV